MAQRKGSSGSGEGQYAKTAANLARKGKTNKKLKSNPQAAKYENSENNSIREKAKQFFLAHKPGTGRRAKKHNAN